MSLHRGKKEVQITKDHKPDDPSEIERIRKAGGDVYRKTLSTRRGTVAGPSRIVPGKLSVSRALGDLKAKHPSYGGNPDVVIPDPDIYTVEVTDAVDFIVMCSTIDSLRRRGFRQTDLQTGGGYRVGLHQGHPARRYEHSRDLQGVR